MANEAQRSVAIQDLSIPSILRCASFAMTASPLRRVHIVIMKTTEKNCRGLDPGSIWRVHIF
jgi:hypothetical protein